MYIAPEQGQKTVHLGTNFWCHQEALITPTIYCKFQTNLFEFWFYTHFLMFFRLYIAPGQGQTTFCGQNSDVNRKALSLCPFVASLKRNLFEVWFFTVFLCVCVCVFFCFFFHMYIAPGRSRQPIGNKNFMTTERPFLFANMLQVLKWSLRNLILYTFLMILYMYIAPGQGQKNPWGQN